MKIATLSRPELLEAGDLDPFGIPVNPADLFPTDDDLEAMYADPMFIDWCDAQELEALQREPMAVVEG